MGMDFIRAKKLITSAQADNATQLTLVDQERASFTRTQMHSGFLNYGGLSDFTFSTGTLNAITVNRDLNVNMNGYPIKIPSGTVIQLNAPPTTGTWDDLVFIEGWLPQVPSTDLSMQWRIRTVSNVNFSLSPEGICHYGVNSVGYFSYALPQGGLSTPTSVAQPLTSPYDAWQYFFIGKDNVNLSVSRNDTNAPVGNKVALNDVGLYVAGDGSANSKARFATYDGYVYAIPIARIKRRNSGGFSASNFNGGRNYKTYTITIPINVNVGYQGNVTCASQSDYDAIQIGDSLWNSFNYNWKVISKNGSLQLTVLNSGATNSGVGSAPYSQSSDRPDSLYSNVIDSRDIPPAYDLRHRTQTQYNYDYELKKASDQFMRGELSPKKMLKTYHGISKTEVDEHTVFYASLDGTTVPEFPLGSSAMNLGTGSFKPMPTGSGYKFNGDSATPVAVSGLSAAHGTFSVLVCTADLKNETDAYPTIMQTLNSSDVQMIALVFSKISNQLYAQEGYVDATGIASNGYTIISNTSLNIHAQVSWDVTNLYLRINGNLISTTTRKSSDVFYVPAKIQIGSNGLSVKLRSTLSDISISNIDRGSLFPNLPADFISGDAQISPAFTNQRHVLSQAQMTQTVSGIAKINNVSGTGRGIVASRTSGSWTSADTITVTGMAGELISGVFDTDTALGTIIKDQLAGDTSLTMDQVTGLAVNDTFQILDRQLGTLRSTVHTVSAITGEVLTITPALTLAVSKYQSLIMETTASSSYPLVSHMVAGVKTTTVGAWTANTTGTNSALFTLGANVGLTTQDLQIDYNTIMPAGQNALTVPTTATLGGMANGGKLVIGLTATRDDFTIANGIYTVGSSLNTFLDGLSTDNLAHVITMVEDKFGVLSALDKKEWLKTNVNKIIITTNVMDIQFVCPIGYDMLVPDNPLHDAGQSTVLFVRGMTREVQSMFPTTNSFGIATYTDYLGAPTPISANTDVTILAEAEDFILTDISSAVGSKIGTHQWGNIAYRTLNDNDNLYGELGYSVVKFPPDSKGINVGSKINVSSTGFANNYWKQFALATISKPMVGIARYLVLVNGELKLFIFSKYSATGGFVTDGTGVGILVNLSGKPLSKEADGFVRSGVNTPTAWKSGELIPMGYVDKATGKLITT